MRNRIADIAIFLCVIALVAYAATRGENGDYLKTLWNVLLEEGPAAAIQRYKDDRQPPSSSNNSSTVAKLNEEYAGKILELINSLRASKGLAKLTLDKDLCEIAGFRARIMSRHGKVTHDLPKEGLPDRTLDKFGYEWTEYAENMGCFEEDDSAGDVHVGFVESPGHYKNMLMQNTTRLGIGIAVDPDGRKWVCELFVTP